MFIYFILGIGYGVTNYRWGLLSPHHIDGLHIVSEPLSPPSALRPINLYICMQLFMDNDMSLPEHNCMRKNTSWPWYFFTPACIAICLWLKTKYLFNAEIINWIALLMLQSIIKLEVYINKFNTAFYLNMLFNQHRTSADWKI